MLLDMQDSQSSVGDMPLVTLLLSTRSHLQRVHNFPKHLNSQAFRKYTNHSNSNVFHYPMSIMICRHSCSTALVRLSVWSENQPQNEQHKRTVGTGYCAACLSFQHLGDGGIRYKNLTSGHCIARPCLLKPGWRCSLVVQHLSNIYKAWGLIL